ncbi:hypothetical protein [Paraburkholderia ginsengisoli]|uniref:Uncharacterized protein n=1 Tax=Paraburkholderia ginsengisoli TaxID=311231 RepID=A0A7T4N222_9BURK|nr:hypothetical protein [Paraburkholderia ginsengisoli]QQC63802.1 hypothetical protein I6I06_16150 [Paraburkholderia ginsengisoli]
MAKNKQADRPLLPKVLAVFAALFAILGLGGGFYLLWHNQTANASLAFTVGLLLLLFSQFERFELVKGFGIEAKIHQLDDKIEEADKINAALKSITGTLSQLAFELMSRIGRLNGPIERKESLEIEEALIKQMRNAEISDDEIDRVVRPVRAIVSFDILRPAVDEVADRLSGWEKSIGERSSRIGQPINMSDPEFQATTADRSNLGRMEQTLKSVRGLPHGRERSEELRQLVADMQRVPAMSDFVPTTSFYEALEDYNFYAKEGSHRDVKRWLAGETL